ncbi:hypothetical protein Taro_017267 [Colocasia esculenta]|uniref:CCHC-type domain-containing protein n=1 Tax=Colocasia esculenta TaxID=4460 RepID=A0A843UQY4_COLES|nr:hypothetical protein [Colocasia esculenta]
MLSRRLQRILAKKKKLQSGRRHFKKNKDFKRTDGKDVKKGEPVCYECKKPGHIKAECPKIKKPEFRKKDSSKKFRKYKKKAMAAAWENSSDSDSKLSSCSDEEDANLAFMANTEDKCVDTPLNGVDTTSQSQRHKAEELPRLCRHSQKAGRHELQIPGISVPRSTHSYSRSTLDPVPRTASLQNWDSRSTHSQSSVSTPPPGQVDTLRKVCNLKWMAATCQPRPMGYHPRIVCPYT